MEENYCHNLLRAEGFELIGSLNYDFRIILWWHPELHLEISFVYQNSWALLRAVKHYRLTAMGKDGELYTRDLAALDAYLTTHFDEVHFWSSSFRDLTPQMAAKKIREKNFRHIANQEDTDTDEIAKRLQQVSDDISVAQAALQRNESLLKLNRGRPSLSQEHLPGQIAGKRRQLEKLRIEKKTLSRQLAVQKHLENQYMHKAEATCLLFTCCSNIQIAGEKEDFADAMHSIVKELQDIHKYQIQQKLQGGKLQIYIEEVDSPAISLLTRWVGAALNPRQLANSGPEFADLYKAVEEQLMVFPRKDILLGGSVQDEKKLVGTRIVRNFLKKLEIVPTATAKSIQSSKIDMPAWIGNDTDGVTKIGNPWELSLAGAGHVYISGSTQAGKSSLAFCIVEVCTTYSDLAVVIITPNNQWAGLLCPEDRPEILERYKLFDLKPEQARSFNFIYHGVGQGIGQPLPKDLRQLASGLHVISFKDSYDQSRCEITADILRSLFDACSRSESRRPRIIVVIDETHRFLKKHVGKKAESAANETEKAIDLVTREGLKYGLQLVILSQTIRDFSYSLGAVRQNIATRIFMRNSDREIDYASEFLDDGSEIVRLKTAEAFCCNSEQGVIRISVRPPLSKVWELPDAEVRKLVESVDKTQPTLSREAHAVVDMARRQYHQTGEPAKLAFIAEQLNITSRRNIERIINEIKNASAAKFERLNKQGKPLVIIPSGAHKPYVKTDTNAHKGNP